LAVLLDREPERAALDGLLETVRGGRSGVLVLRGEPGVGKTALLEYTIESAAGLRIAQVAGVESEMEFTFAALHQLCEPMLDELDCLPVPQRTALGVAFGMRDGDPPDRFLVGLAVLSLLSAVAERWPLLCVIDDAQWLDRASSQVLAFVARRLLAEPVGLLAATRELSADFRGLPELPVGGLPADAARELLGSVIRGPLDERVRDRIIAETGGNPLALLELPPGRAHAEVGGGFRLLPDSPAVWHQIEDNYRRRMEDLPAAARRLLLVAAAEATGDPVLLWRAAEQLGIAREAAATVEATGWLTIGRRVSFCHPLARSAAYQAAASADDLRAAHGALAEATDPEADPLHRAWHRAQAVAGPDEQVADELERWAGRAQVRGGPAKAAAFLERSAALTPGPDRRAERALAAAQATFQAGVLDSALALLAAAEAGPLDELRAAQAGLLRGQVAFAANWGSDAPPLLLKAARRLERLDPALARETYLDALAAAMFAARVTPGGPQAVALAARAAPPPPQPARAADLLLDGLARLISEGYAAGVPSLRTALNAFRGDGITREEELRWVWLAHQSALAVWDYQTWDVLSGRHVALARETGSLASLSIAYNSRAGVYLFGGEFAEAEAMVAEADSVSAAIGSSGTPYGALALAAFRGREAEAAALAETAWKDAERRGEGEGLTLVNYVTAVLCNSLGRYEDALAAARQASEDLSGMWSAKGALAELIEGAARSGAPGPAVAAFEQLAGLTSACGTDWSLGLEARCRALISDGEAADSSYREAIDRLGRAGVRMEAARAQLLYGEWLRRRQRSREGRDQLRSAYEAFDSMGAEAFAERARIELRATGGSARRRADPRDDLTAQEALIARLASGGASNPEIAAQLFLSPATVAYHLRKVFAKLGISSRSQLASVLPAAPRTAPRASSGSTDL
jgi:DNA-binding CsgD family transcriptional regulator